MIRYNIYAGLGGSFGGASYQFTGMYKSEEMAMNDAYEIASNEYEIYRIKGFDDVIEEYCNTNDIPQEDLTSEDYGIIKDMYLEEVESWITYHVVKTDEDNIDEEDLILDYVIEDDSSSEADSE